MWAMGAAVERGELPREDLESAQRGACPTCGACQFMGSASTGQGLSADPVLNVTTAIVTDGRYSGAMRGPCIGHVAPEAIDGGPIALVADHAMALLLAARSTSRASTPSSATGWSTCSNPATRRW